MVDDAIQKGAELMCGGKREGAFYYQTVLDNIIIPIWKLVKEEIISHPP